MEENIKQYEIGFLVREEADVDEIKKELHSQKAEIYSEAKLRKLKFAYPVEKENFGFFGYILFSLDASLIKGISDRLKLNQKVLRTMVINLPKGFEAKEEGEKKERPSTSRTARPEKPVKKETSDIVDNEMLEKKLEEILK